jgi:hypothetical protein
MEMISLPRHIALTRETQFVIFKKKKNRGKTRAAMQLGKGVWRTAHKPTAWRAMHFEVVGRKKVVGGKKERGRDNRRQSVGCMLIRLRMRRTTAGVYKESLIGSECIKKSSLICINLCVNIYFFNFRSNIEYIFSSY